MLLSSARAMCVAGSQACSTAASCIAMNAAPAVANARAKKRRRAVLRHVGSLLGGALLGTAIVTPILAGGDAVDGDALVIVVAGALALLGIGAHIAGSAAPARASANTKSTSSPIHSRRVFARRTRA